MSRRSGALVFFGLALTAIAYAPALIEWEASGYGDWRQFHHWWEVGRIAIFRWHEVPLWDPNHCGGVSMWGQPQSQLYSPTWWITGLAFGTVTGHKLFIGLHHVIGFTGMYVVARELFRYRPPAATLTAIVFAFCGWIVWRGAGGHSTFLGFLYLPWIFVFWRRSNADIRYTGAVAALMALVLLEGGTYPFPFAAILLGYDFVAQLLIPPPATPRWTVVRTALVAGTLALFMGALRLWPVYVTMSRFPRNTAMEDTQTWEELLCTLTCREPMPWHFGHRWVWPEYGTYVGWIVVGLVAVGLLVALRRSRRWQLVAGFFFFATLSMGNVDEHWPWPLLHQLPVFENFHVPSRFQIIFAFYLALLAGLAMDRWLYRALRRLNRRWARGMVLASAWFVILCATGDIMSNDVQIASRWEGLPIGGEPNEHYHLVVSRDYLNDFFQFPQRNVGTPYCYDPVPWELSPALWTGDRPQVLVEPPGAGAVLSESRTNMTATATVHLDEAARIIWNQNYDPDWVTSVGEPIETRGLLAVELPAGDHTVRARFAPPDLPWSVVISVSSFFAWLFGVLLINWRRRRMRRAEDRATRASGTPGDVGASP